MVNALPSFLRAALVLSLYAYAYAYAYVSPAMAVHDANAANANASLFIAEKEMQNMVSKNLPVTRYNDTLLSAKQIFDAQFALERAGGNADYSLVYERINDLQDMRYLALKAFDELGLLGETIDKARDIDHAPVLELYDQAKNECESERYEQCLAAIEKAYEKISELEAIQTKVKAFYEATSRSMLDFLRDEWKNLAMAAALILAITLLGYNRVLCRIISRRIVALEIRKESIKGLIAKTQKEYFDDKKISETAYYVRAKKYGELLRDINRQIPLLKEELVVRQKKSPL